ncbi:MAG TPA: MarR family transcriptional regulator [Caulobacteraceae bacterium]|nr:MarR family transcriptional regulator [Caulobacteraceae bacterium]
MALDPDLFHGLSDFRYALRRFLSASEVISRAAGVTQQQYQAMLAIKASDERGMAMKDLAGQLLLTQHAAVQMMDRLARAGLAERRQAPGDRRSVLVALTARGEGVVSELAAAHLAEMLRQEPLLRRSLTRLKRLGRK